MLTDERAVANPSFSILDAALQSLQGPGEDGVFDVDISDTPECLYTDAAYLAIFDDSPLTPPPLDSNPSSRAPSPQPATAALSAPPVLSVPLDSCLSSRASPPEPTDAPLANKFSLPGQPRAPKRPSSDNGRDKSNKKARKSKKNHEHRRKQRAAARAADPTAAHRATPAQKAAKHVQPAHSAPAEYNAANIPCASTGFVALQGSGGGVHTLDELVNERGFTVIKADRDHPRAILDKNGLVIAVVLGAPKDSGWDEVHQAAHELLMDSAKRCHFAKKSKAHRRGNFAALNVGIAHGMGLQAPGNLTHTNVNKAELDKLLAAEPFVRIAGFASSGFATWAPNLYNYYDDHLSDLTAHHPSLRRNFSNSVWASAAFNFGPQTVTAKHRDCQNIPFGWCGVTALGNFDYTLGGHIVLWELKLVVELPPGFTILLPSAVIAHSNTPIQPHETRTSFTQYSAGGLFRWVQHGFQKESEYTKDFEKADWDEVAAENAERCKLGTKLFSTLEELRTLHKAK